MTTPSELEERLGRLETAEAARDLIAAYAEHIDQTDVAALAQIFSPDIILTARERRWQGTDEVTEFFRSAFAANPSGRRHFLTNIALSDLTPTSASATSYFLYVTAFPATSIIGWGRYSDRFDQVDGELRIVEKDIKMDFSGPLSDGWADVLAKTIPSS